MQNLKKCVDGLFNLWQEHPGAGGQLVVIHKGETVLERCYGYANIEKKIPITQDTVFAVASVTKQITAMSIMILQDRGLLDIHDDIRKYIPDLVGFTESVTISNLLHHTSGIRERSELGFFARKEGMPPLTRQELLAVIAQQKSLNFTPGTEFVYCNTGYVLLAVIVERVSGMPYPEFAKKNIFEPLGMDSTFFLKEVDLPEEKEAIGYHDDGHDYIAAPFGALQVYGCGGMRSTCRDMVKFMPQYKNPTLVSRETMEKLYLHIPPLADGTVTNYACGVRINELEGHRYFHHGGVIGGFRTFTVIFPDDDLVIAVYTNTYNIPIEVAGRDVARIVLGLPSWERKNLEAYRTKGVEPDIVPGGYISTVGGTLYEIGLQNGQPHVMFNDAWALLDHVGDNLYKMGRRNISFAFGQTVAINHEELVRPLRKLPDTFPETAKEYAGRYYCRELDNTFTIVWEEGKLRVDMPALKNQRMYLLEEDVFRYGSMKPLRWIRFKRENGVITGFVHDTHQTRGLVFEKEL